jgi:hypothetical protein
MTVREREPEYTFRLFWPSGTPKFELSVGGPHGDGYQAIGFWPSGQIRAVEHGTLDDALAQLKAIRAERWPDRDSVKGCGTVASDA